MITQRRAAQILLPHNGWTPRPDQMTLWNYLDATPRGARADIVAHRRWGKDEIALHRAAVACQKEPGVYWHMLPEAAQARKAIWEAVNPRTGKRRIDEAFPHDMRANTRDQDMMIRMKNGSVWYVVGSDNYDSLVGSPPRGVTFSEWALADPKAWGYIRPILLENGGWAIFIWTPRYGSHAIKTFRAREEDPMWFTQRLSAEETGVFTLEQLVQEKKELMRESASVQEGEALYQSEYLVDFDAPVPGSYYAEHLKMLENGWTYDMDSRGYPKLTIDGKLMPLIRTQKRICDLPWDPKVEVETAWDLGIDDYTSIWWFQRYDDRVHVIDFYETNGLGFDEIKREAFDGKPYKYGRHHLPHDVKVRELGAGGRTRRQSLHQLGFRNVMHGAAMSPEDQVTAVRRLLPYCYFDKTRCALGVEHLKAYKKKWNKSLNQYTGPLHDEHSHAASAFREIAVNVNIIGMPIANDTPKERDRWKELFDRKREEEKQMSSWKVA